MTRCSEKHGYDDAFDVFRLLSDSTAESQAMNKSIDATSMCHAATPLAVEYNEESSHLHLPLFVVFNLVYLDAECLLCIVAHVWSQVHIVNGIILCLLEGL